MLLAGGCAEQAGADNDKPSRRDRAHGMPAVEASWVSCEQFIPAPDGMLFGGGAKAAVLPMLDESFPPVAAVICRSDSQPHPGGGWDLVAIEERADDITALVAALRLPDQNVHDCHGEFWAQYIPWLALVDAQGRWIRPGIPLAPCNAPRAEVKTAIEQLTTTRVSTRVLRRNDRDVAKAGGCHDSEEYDQVFGPDRMPVPATLPDAGIPMRVCRFLAEPTVEDGRTYYLRGLLQDGEQLTAAGWAAVRHEIDVAPPAAPCNQVSPRFAVLREKSWSRPVSVEADGCRRVLIEGSEFNLGDMRQGSGKLVSLLYHR
ncbi:hypothetical protein Adu01nite_28500 [Paractinoplanes durhamensis]|uniref:Lipoprotein n=1 Tax=Paractinoplanes durhamensis TaxID=113563 RepID=A0ABQ3YV79_9ACTN|nr:hypothetical protein Adu01nite_28500 [Actinoplanes durhamensis]